MSKLLKLYKALAAVKAATPYVKATVLAVAHSNDAVDYKHKSKVEKVLNGVYKAADVLERVL